MADQEEIAPPSLLNLIFTGLFGLLFGLIIGCISMSMIKIKEVKELPPVEEREPKAVYFVKGDEKDGRDFPIFQRQFEQSRPGTFSLLEGHLNQWGRKAFKVTTRPGEDGGNLLFGMPIEFGQINFHVDGDQLQIASYISLPKLAAGRKFLFQAKGRFKEVDGTWEFVAETAYIGSCPLPNLAGLPNIVENLLTQSYLENKEMGEMYSAWLKIKNIQFNGGRLVITI